MCRKSVRNEKNETHLQGEAEMNKGNPHAPP